MIFPSGDVLAQAMFEEAIRHLEDARALHEAGRLPGAITSAMKAAELGFKAALLLENTFGWWEGVMTSHTPVTDIGSHVVLGQVVAHFSPALVTILREMERLSPSRLGKKAFASSRDPINQEERNPEYPFILVEAAAVRIEKPSDYFMDAQVSRDYYEAARELLTEITTLYAAAGQWKLTLPFVLLTLPFVLP